MKITRITYERRGGRYMETSRRVLTEADIQREEELESRRRIMVMNTAQLREMMNRAAGLEER